MEGSPVTVVAARLHLQAEVDEPYMLLDFCSLSASSPSSCLGFEVYVAQTPEYLPSAGSSIMTCSASPGCRQEPCWPLHCVWEEMKSSMHPAICSLPEWGEEGLNILSKP